MKIIRNVELCYYTGMTLWPYRGKRQMQKTVATGTQNKRFIHTTILKTKTKLTNPLSRIQVGTARTPPQEIFAEFVGKRKFIFFRKNITEDHLIES